MPVNRRIRNSVVSERMDYPRARSRAAHGSPVASRAGRIIDMNGWLIIAGAMIVCFADREAISLEFKGGTKISLKYPLFGVLMIVTGVVMT